MQRELTEDEIDSLAEKLIGTFDTLDEGLYSAFNLTEDEVAPYSLGRVEEMIFNCLLCGVWEDLSRIGENGLCSRCEDALDTEILYEDSLSDIEDIDFEEEEGI